MPLSPSLQLHFSFCGLEAAVQLELPSAPTKTLLADIQSGMWITAGDLHVAGVVLQLKLKRSLKVCGGLVKFLRH